MRNMVGFVQEPEWAMHEVLMREPRHPFHGGDAGNEQKQV